MPRSLLKIFVGLAAFLVAATFAAQAGMERIVSRYTSTARVKSLSYQEARGEGVDGFRALHRGFGGYQLEHLAGDERSWINVKYKNHTVDLYAATMEAGGGTFPRKANDIVEWRGSEKDGVFTPCAIIYRLEAGNDETRKTHTRLIVIKLDGPKSAIVGYAQGKNEQADAHRLADNACARSKTD